MFEHTRQHLVKPVENLNELVERLQKSAPLCDAFKLGDLIFANDSSCEDAAQEFAVVRDGRLIESITVSWCTPEELRELITHIADGDPPCNREWRGRLDHPTDGSCGYCE